MERGEEQGKLRDVEKPVGSTRVHRLPRPPVGGGKAIVGHDSRPLRIEN